MLVPMETRSISYAYATSVAWTEQRMGVASVAGKPDLQVATPPEFKGHPGIWSPEDLYVAAVNTCLMTTFLALAEKSRLELASYSSEAEGRLELADARLRFTSVVLRPHVVVSDPSKVSAAQELLHKAEANCLVSSSITAKVTLEPHVSSKG